MANDKVSKALDMLTNDEAYRTYTKHQAKRQIRRSTKEAEQEENPVSKTNASQRASMYQKEVESGNEGKLVSEEGIDAQRKANADVLKAESKYPELEKIRHENEDMGHNRPEKLRNLIFSGQMFKLPSKDKDNKLHEVRELRKDFKKIY